MRAHDIRQVRARLAWARVNGDKPTTGEIGMSHLENRRRSRVGVLLAALLLGASGAVVSLASPASAAVCDTISAGYTHPDGVARVTFTATKDCSNHTTRVYGTLYDTSCDSRSVYLDVIYSGGTFGNSAVSHGGGCNTSRGFDVSAGDTSGSSVQVCLKAANSFGQSSRRCSTYYF
jgi:hypothetical protein